MILAATGHRPDQLGGYSDAILKRLVPFARSYLESVPEAQEAVSGLALGWDTAWALAALDRGIPLVAAVPFEGQENRWPPDSQRLYADILRRASRVEIVSRGGYAPWKLQRRNEWMVDRAHRMVALWNGSPGGTANCIFYAQQKRKPFENLWPRWQREAEQFAP